MKVKFFIARFFSKTAKVLENLSSPRTQLPPSVKIHPSSEFEIGRLHFKPECSVIIDEQSQVPGLLIFDKEKASISIGKRVFMNGSIIAAKSIDIGDDVLIAWGVTIIDHNSHSISFSKRSNDVIDAKDDKKNWEHVQVAPVKISNKVWIGFNSIILKGVTIGEGAVVGAGSVVTKNILPWTIVAGNPARAIRQIPENER